MSDQVSPTKAIAVYMKNDEIRSSFADVLGSDREAGAYIGSVLLTVANTPSLQECTAQSIYTSALRAATLRLSVDPSTGQAYLVPFNDKSGRKICTLIVGYKGLHDMAVRTNKYRYINAGPLYEGQSMVEDQLTGASKIEGHPTSHKVIGWFAAFEMMNGYSKVLYMTLEAIHAHAQKYSKNYTNNNSKWKTDPAVMEKKTPLRMLLRKWGYLNATDASVLEQMEDEQAEIIDGEMKDVTDATAAPSLASDNMEPPDFESSEQVQHELGF